MAKKTDTKTTVETKSVTKAVEKETVKKETVKAKKPAKKQEVYIQFGDREVLEKDVLDKVKKAWTESGKKVGEMIDVKIYIKPEDAMAYYVINDEFSGSIEL